MLSRVRDLLRPTRGAITRLRGVINHRGTRLFIRVCAVVLVGLLGGWLGMTLGGQVQTALGPADVELTVRPSWDGGTIVDIPPLGTLRFDTHEGPIQLRARVARIRPESAQRLIKNSADFDRFTKRIGDQVAHGITMLAIKVCLTALVCAGLAGLIVFRSWRRALLSMATTLTGVVVVAIVAAVTFNPGSVGEPRFTGILSSVPQVVGDAKSLVKHFDAYREQLAKIVSNVSELYDVTSTLPTYEPDPSTIRVLHVSDIHLNPVAWNVIRSVTEQFKIQLIIDSGDLTDHGSEPERKFVKPISTLKVPYVFVRGNHDSMDIQKAVAKEKNAVVLDDETKKVAGLRIYGIGDPRFTPDKSTRADSISAHEMYLIGQGAATRLRASGKKPDIVVVHDPNEGKAFAGLAPLIMSGHAHKRSTRLLPGGTRLFVQGSTGGAGLRSLEHEKPTPIELSVLYFNRKSHRLQGWDNITVGGLGLTTARIKRTLEPKPDRPIGPPPAPAPQGSPVPASPTPTPTASTSTARPDRH